jgi:CubicO group peptidase (beta-lactamase class C family)
MRTTASAAAEPTDRIDLDALATETAAELGIVGAQIAVLHRRSLSLGVAGVANIATGLPVTADTMFQIGSTTKIFTALLVMGLVDEKRIDLETPVAEQLPGFVLSDPGATASITPRHLMSMSSGIDNGPYTDYGRGDDALARYVDDLVQLPHIFPPGSAYGYSNASTCVSGRLAELVTGASWERALRERVVEPAGLTDTATSAEDVLHRRFAVGHVARPDGTPVPQRLVFNRSKGPSGGFLCSTARDLVRLAHAFMHEGLTVDGHRVVSGDVVDAMQERVTPVPPTLLAEWWGLGPYGKVWDGVEIMGHSGTTGGGSSYLLWARAREFAIATTVNSPGVGYPFAARVFRRLFPLAGIEVPPPAQPPTHVEFDPAPLVGTYQMSGVTLTVSREDGGLAIEGVSENPGTERHIARSPLIALTPRTFLPTNPAIDGRRGWALAFVGPEHGPAHHLLNGFFALRRIA